MCIHSTSFVSHASARNWVCYNLYAFYSPSQHTSVCECRCVHVVYIRVMLLHSEYLNATLRTPHMLRRTIRTYAYVLTRNEKHEATELFPTPDGKNISTFLVHTPNSLGHMQMGLLKFTAPIDNVFAPPKSPSNLCTRRSHSHKSSHPPMSWLGLSEANLLFA